MYFDLLHRCWNPTFWLHDLHMQSKSQIPKHFFTLLTMQATPKTGESDTCNYYETKLWFPPTSNIPSKLENFKTQEMKIWIQWTSYRKMIRNYYVNFFKMWDIMTLAQLHNVLINWCKNRGKENTEKGDYFFVRPKKRIHPFKWEKWGGREELVIYLFFLF